MTGNHVAIATTTIHAGADAVWNALVDPALIKQYMFGSEVTSDWTEGSTIVYAGEYEGKPYEDHGTILELRPNEVLRTTHFSPLSGKADVPENYHTLSWQLEAHDQDTTLTLTQDNNDTEEAAQHSKANWDSVLAGLKELVEAAE